MDFAFYEFVKKLNHSIHSLTKKMSVLSDRVVAVIQFLQAGESSLRQELADVKAQLADALAKDAADAETVANAQAEAQSSRAAADEFAAKVTELQAIADADTAEDAAITAALDAVEGAPN
jgi:DNA repair exonuclease SbcCD ATPase subunit